VKPLARLAGVTLLGLVAALPARAESLADTLVAAYRHSALVEQNRAVLRAADEDVAASVGIASDCSMGRQPRY